MHRCDVHHWALWLSHCALCYCLAVPFSTTNLTLNVYICVCVYFYRLDTTLIDFTDMKCQRGDLSFIFNGNAIPSESFVVLDNEQKVYQRIHHEVSETQAGNRLTCIPQSLKSVSQPTRRLTANNCPITFSEKHKDVDKLGLIIVQGYIYLISFFSFFCCLVSNCILSSEGTWLCCWFVFPSKTILFVQESEMETEEEVDILMSSDVYSATLSTKSITFSRAQTGWLFREDKTVGLGYCSSYSCCVRLYTTTVF